MKLYTKVIAVEFSWEDEMYLAGRMCELHTSDGEIHLKYIHKLQGKSYCTAKNSQCMAGP